MLVLPPRFDKSKLARCPYLREKLAKEIHVLMKKRILLGVMMLFCAVPVVVWADTVTGGLPLGAYLYDLGRLLAAHGFCPPFLSVRAQF